jgi:hypothetical protein
MVSYNVPDRIPLPFEVRRGGMLLRSSSDSRNPSRRWHATTWNRIPSAFCFQGFGGRNSKPYSGASAIIFCFSL